MRAKNRLTAKGIVAAKPGKHLDGDGLLFVKREDGGAQWVLRYTLYSRRHDMGLGAYPEVSLAEARRKADEARAKARNNIDPIRDRERERREAVQNLYRLADIAADAFESRKHELRDNGDAGRWFSPLRIHVLPKLGQMPVAEIGRIDIRDTFAKLWHEKPDTARKAMTRLHICMKHAAALGLNVDLKAIDMAKALLGKRMHETKHIPSMPWQEIPAFYARLNSGALSELALKLVILTGVRSNPIRHMHEEQIEGNVWTIPAVRVKGQKGKTTPFRVPLSEEAMSVLGQARKLARDGHIFPGVKKGVMSDMAMLNTLDRMEVKARPHGFRSSLRIWLAEVAEAPFEVAETVLTHSTGNNVSRSYTRDFDHLEKRRVLMERWGQFVTGKTSGEVVQLVAKSD
jgi:integrase